MISPSRLNLRRRNTSGVSPKDRPILGGESPPGMVQENIVPMRCTCSVSSERASLPVVPVKVAFPPPPPKRPGTPPL